MPRPYSNYVNNAMWDDPNKIESRQQVIVGVYREVFNTPCIPVDQQYWTMCGAYYNAHGEHLRGELGQLTSSGLITINQFHGVDHERVIIERNKHIYPHINWYYGDFRTVMGNAAIQGTFNPAIINYDGVMQPEFGTKYLKSILKFLDNNVGHPLLLVSNFVLKTPYRRQTEYTVTDVIVRLKNIYFFPDHWSLFPYVYEYNGSGKRSNSHMGQLVLIKKAHNPNSISYIKNRKIT